MSCYTSWSCIEDYQTLISGILAVGAAVGTAVAVWLSARLPIKHQRLEAQALQARKRYYVALVLSRNFRLLATRAAQAKSTVIAVKAANGTVTDDTKRRATLIFDAVIDNWELMSVFPVDILGDIADLQNRVADHNFDIERAGGAFGADNFAESIKDRCDAIRAMCASADAKLNRFMALSASSLNDAEKALN